MNTRFLNTICVRAALLLGSLGALSMSAHAQLALTRATVPFEFAASGVMMPAGQYTIDASDTSSVILLRGSSGSAIVLLSTFSGTVSNSGAKLIFERHDGMAYLSGVEWPGQSARIVFALKPVSKGAVAAALR